MKLKIKKKYADAVLPTRGSAGAAGLDLYAYVDEAPCFQSVVLEPGQVYKFGSGICAEIPEGYVGLLFARSGLGINKQLAPPNCVGVIDSDYRGEICLAILNNGTESQTISHGDRIAQLVIVPYLDAEPEEIDTLSETARGEGGFGSTGRR